MAFAWGMSHAKSCVLVVLPGARVPVSKLWRYFLDHGSYGRDFREREELFGRFGLRACLRRDVGMLWSGMSQLGHQHGQLRGLPGRRVERRAGLQSGPSLRAADQRDLQGRRRLSRWNMRAVHSHRGCFGDGVNGRSSRRVKAQSYVRRTVVIERLCHESASIDGVGARLARTRSSALDGGATTSVPDTCTRTGLPRTCARASGFPPGSCHCRARLARRSGAHAPLDPRARS